MSTKVDMRPTPSTVECGWGWSHVDRGRGVKDRIFLCAS